MQIYIIVNLIFWSVCLGLSIWQLIASDKRAEVAMLANKTYCNGLTSISLGKISVFANIIVENKTHAFLVTFSPKEEVLPLLDGRVFTCYKNTKTTNTYGLHTYDYYSDIVWVYAIVISGLLLFSFATCGIAAKMARY